MTASTFTKNLIAIVIVRKASSSRTPAVNTDKLFLDLCYVALGCHCRIVLHDIPRSFQDIGS